jgi:hypothetical protein
MHSGPSPEDDARALLSMSESGSQPTSTVGGDTYNKSYVGWDMSGAAFEMEFEALDSYAQNDPEAAALSTNLWSDRTHLPLDMEGMPLATFSAFNPRGTGDTLCDTISGPHLLDSDQSKSFPSHDSYPKSHATIDTDPTSTSASNQCEASNAGMTSQLDYVEKSATLATTDASIVNQLWSPRFHVQPDGAERHITSSNACPHGGFVESEQPELEATDAHAASHSVEPLSALQYPTDFQPLRTLHPEQAPHRHIPLSGALGTPILHPHFDQRSPPHGGTGRHKRLKSSSGEPIAIHNHMITHELPWQLGAKVPASVSQGSFHTFSVSGQSVPQRTRKPFTAAQRAKVNAVRKMTACLNCRHAKAPVSHRRE